MDDERSLGHHKNNGVTSQKRTDEWDTMLFPDTSSAAASPEEPSDKEGVHDSISQHVPINTYAPGIRQERRKAAAESYLERYTKKSQSRNSGTKPQRRQLFLPNPMSRRMLPMAGGAGVVLLLLSLFFTTEIVQSVFSAIGGQTANIVGMILEKTIIITVE